MPPRGHSSGSHSSHSHSSSSRSHSSRSFSRRSGSSSRSGSSPHSRSSHSSRSYTAASRTQARPRTNQPSGYRGASPVRHYARRHDYVFYPVGWTDSVTGREYKEGYYDENGQYYEDVAFKTGDQYDNVLCRCEYCGKQSKMTWKENMTLSCPGCGAPLTIVSALDEEEPQQQKAAAGSLSASAISALVIFIVAVVFIIVVAASIFSFSHSSRPDYVYSIDEEDPGYASAPDNTEIFGDTIYLDKIDDSTYVISEDGNESYDRKLTWDYGYDSYYDRDSDCYLWYNTDVAPNLWQYWYEGISSDYGDYGWMEYEESGWYIEESDGYWVSLPDFYDKSRLWHIEE